MKVAVIGSRNLQVEDLAPYLPEGVSELISGGAKGIDTCVREYAEARGIPLTEIKPDYARYGRGAPHVRNRAIVDAADEVVAIWDGESRGTASVVAYCERVGSGSR